METFIIFDTEYTTWMGCQEKGWDPKKNQFMELVQIGAVKVDFETLEVLDTYNILIKPDRNPELSVYFQKLTGLTQEHVNKTGVSAKNAIRDFNVWRDGIKTFSYGNDLVILKKNVKLHSLEVELQEELFFDIRSFFLLNNVPCDDFTSGSLHKYFKIDMNGQVHNSFFDAMSVLESLRFIRNEKITTKIF